MASRLHRRNDGSPSIHFPQFRALLREYLPEVLQRTRTDQREAGDQWTTFRVRPEVSLTVAALIERHEAVTGNRITKSEVLAAAFNLALPVLVTRLFPEAEA